MKYTISTVALLIVAIAFCASCGDQGGSSIAEKSFDSTLAIHLNAIKNANLSALEPTVADSVTLISPTGDRMNSKEAFMKLHENWFRQKYWQWEGTFLRTESTDSLGYALIRYTYTQKDSIGNVKFQNKSYLVLIFKNSAKGWQLVHDQNTSIPN
jgi:ketosteroid isomerase-like protein